MKHLKRVILTVVVMAVSIYLLSLGIDAVLERFYPHKYSEFVEKYSAQYGVDADLVYAVIKCESGFDPKATSSVEAKGLMQLTDDTFEWVQTKTGESGYAPDDLYDPETAVKYGTKLLSLHLNEFEDEALALAAYHAGRSAVTGWLADEKYADEGGLHTIPYAETAVYVERVQSTKEIYEKIYRED